MSRRLFDLYQYLAPAVLTPLSFWLWWQASGGDLWLTLIAWAVPIVHAYVVPGVGTNLLKVWEFDTRLRLGRFRPHHGFVFGSATASLAWLCRMPVADAWDVLRLAFVMAGVLGFWNLIYDIRALQSGLLRVYNQPWADGRGAEAVALDYVPWFFAGFGAVYGAGLGLALWLAGGGKLAGADFAWLFPLTLTLGMALPVWAYRRQSFRRHGHSGCRPVAKESS